MLVSQQEQGANTKHFSIYCDKHIYNYATIKHFDV